jgi:DNA-binding transcriptional ArsR family regulator
MGATSLADLDGCDIRVVDADRVDSVLRKLPDDDLIGGLADVFAILGDPSRLRLLISLLEGGEMCVCDLAVTSGLSESATSHALRLLRVHAVVQARRSGRMMRYSLRDGHVRMLLDLALEHVRHGHD